MTLLTCRHPLTWFLVHAKKQLNQEKTEICEVQDCVVYVPILKTLERLLENEDVVTQVNQCIALYNDDNDIIIIYRSTEGTQASSLV